MLTTDGVCTCSEGEDFVDVNGDFQDVSCFPQNIVDAYAKCKSADYGPSVGGRNEPAGNTCTVLSRDAGRSVDYPSCFLDDAADTVSPHCTDVFGPGLDIPQKPTDGSPPRYVFNCDPAATSGLLPATVNTVAATECVCPAGQSVQNGACADIVCPDGQTGVLASDSSHHCVPNAAAAVAAACAAAGWGKVQTIDISGQTHLYCPVRSARYYELTTGVFQLQSTVGQDGASLGCGVTGDSFKPTCVEMFGNPPQFPQSDGDDDQRQFLANCSRDGGVPGGVPAGINLVEATECACADGGDYPDCACPFGQGLLNDNTCGVCPPGQGVRAGGNICDICPYDQGVLADGNCGVCPSGQGVRDSTNTCGVCPSGQVPQAGACNACSGGQTPQDGACACPAGWTFIKDLRECYPDAVAETADKCVDSGHSRISHGAWDEPDFSCRIKNQNSQTAVDLEECRFPDAVKSRNPGVRLCSEVFGPDLNFPAPTLNAGGATLSFVFNCDPDGTNGMIPAAINTIEATECACPAGERAVEFASGEILCYPEMVADAADKCRRSGHVPAYGLPSGTNLHACAVSTRNADSQDGGQPTCLLSDSAADSPRCSEVFGPDLAFPQKPAVKTTLTYVYNCDPNNKTGIIPATANTIGATECACPAGQGILDIGICGVCPTGQGLHSDNTCGVCSSGQGVLPDGTCGVCPTGQGVFANGNCGECPTGQGIFPDGTCGVCPRGQGAVPGGTCGACAAGFALQGGVCTCAGPAGQEFINGACACPAGQGVYNNACGDCPIGQEIDDNGNCRACPSGQGIFPDGQCHACPTDAREDPATLTNGVCTCTAVIGQEVINGACACPDGQGIRDDNSCGSCVTGEVIDGNGYCNACPNGQGIFPDGKCHVCPDSASLDDDGACVCPDGFIASQGACASLACSGDSERFQVSGYSFPWCVSNAAANIAKACEAAGWGQVRGANLSGQAYMYCPVRSARYALTTGVFQLESTDGQDGVPLGGCGITGDSFKPTCVEMFGDPPQFPQSDGDDDQRQFWANCSRDGTLPGGIPAGINRVEATECACANGGDYPNCACPSGQGLLDNNTCAVCPPGQGVRSDNHRCAVCPSGEGILSDGTCGACPEGRGILDAVNACGVCPSGEGILSDGTCGACPEGRGILDNTNACGVCPFGEGILSDGTCGACPSGEGILSDGTCGACPSGEGILSDGTCAACPEGRGILDNTNACGVCPSGEGILSDGTCDACPSGEGVLSDGTCGACPARFGQILRDGVCACPPGEGAVDAGSGQFSCYPQQVADRHNKCVDRGYDASIVGDDNRCAVPNWDVRGGSGRHKDCLLNDDASGGPLCAQIFGPDFAVPQKPADADENNPRYVFNCDSYKNNGSIPATINTIGATACACPDGWGIHDGVCVAACPFGRGILADGTCGDCPAGETVQDGVCAFFCPDGQRAVSASAGDERRCVSNANADVADACVAAGWDVVIKHLYPIEDYPTGSIDVYCTARSYRLLFYNGGYRYAAFRVNNKSIGCSIKSVYVSPLCVDMFGDPPQFPQSAGDDDERQFVANCSRDGTLPGGIPADLNLVEATECACADGGNYPNCGCAPGEGLRDDNTCGVCPDRQGVLEGVLSDGTCGFCPGEGVLSDGTCGDCPSGQDILGDNTCGDCPSGASVDNGVCTCPFGQGVLADGPNGICGVCPAGQGIRPDKTCGVCPAGQGAALLDGICGACLPGQVLRKGACIACPGGAGPGESCACPPGERAVTDSSGSGCFPEDKADVRESCVAKGWGVQAGAAFAGRLACDIPVGSWPHCAIHGGDAAPCADVFGDPPQLPNKAGDDGRPFVYNCSSDGTIPAVPGRFNRNREKTCVCSTGGTFPNCDPCDGGKVVINGACGACPAGQDVHNGVCIPRAIVDGTDKCASAGWSVSVYVDGGGAGFCGVPLTLSGGDAADGCGLSGGLTPQCATVFTPDLAFPQKPSNAARYVYNCDPGGVTGLIPATANTVQATECACPAGQGLVDGVCSVCPIGREEVHGVCVAACAADKIRVNGQCSARIPPSEQAETLYQLLRMRASVLAAAFQTADILNTSADAVLARNAGDADYCAPINRYDFADSPDYNLFAHDEFRVVANQAGHSLGATNTDGQICRVLTELPSFLDLTRCATSGWEYSTGVNSACGVLLTLSGGAAVDACYLSGTLSPQCANVFGAGGVPPPVLSPQGATLRFIYNCDPNGVSGLLPATVNAVRATECACPVGEELVAGQCVSSIAANSCRTSWTLFEDVGACGVPLTLSGGAASDRCHLTGSAAPQCASVFGDKAAIPPPALSPQGATLRFVYNCDPNRATGLLPAAANTVAATQCGCPAGEHPIGGVCAASPAADKCLAKGWTLFAAEGACGVPVTLSGQAASDRCYFTGPNSPQCADVFGAPENDFPSPTLAASGAPLPFVYNCDPGATSGLIPAAANTVAATECGCPAGRHLFDGVCSASPAADSCLAGGWPLSLTDRACEIPVRYADGASSNRCYWTGLAKPQCADVFGTNPAFPPPTLSAAGATLHYVYNCDPNEDQGIVPATINTIRATACACPDPEMGFFNGRCELAATVVAGAWSCAAVGRTFDPAQGGSCALAITLFGGDLYDKCYFSGESAPQCVDVFGAGFNFPLASNPAAVVYNCDPEDNNGLLPATINTVRATECACPLGRTLKDGACVEPSTPIERCAAQGWVVDPAGWCDIRFQTPDDDNPARWCFFDSAAQQASGAYVHCKDVFGTDYDFPPNPMGGSPPVYKYNCDPDGTVGALPATVNLNGETECRCDDSGGTWPNCAGNACSAAGWDYAAADGVCAVLVTMAGGEASDQCRFTGSDSPQCADVFGTDLQIPAPTVDADGATLHFVYDCDPRRSNGLLPATANTIAATACGCPDGEYLLGGACVASPAADSCLAGGWSLSLADGACGAPVTLSGDTASDRCYLIGDTAPQCADVFGANPEIPAPKLDAGGATLHFVYDCDPNDETGLVPATANTIAATACGCPDGEYLLDGTCVASPTADSCLAGGWSLSLADGACGAPVTLSGGDASDRCYLTGDAAPQCADVFGADPEIPAPKLDAGGATLHFVYNCNPNGGLGGLIPATINTIAATACRCPSGKRMVANVCVAAPAVESCLAGGWSLSLDDGACGVPVTLSGDVPADRCYFTGSESPQCADVFGADMNIPAPTVDDNGATLRFVYNCDPDGGLGGLVPATVNTIAATACGCSSKQAMINGVCTDPRDKCAVAGWDYNANSDVCGVVSRDVGDGFDRFFCRFDAAPSFTELFFPRCADVFGAGYDFPQKPPEGSAPVYVYNCDPDGTAGALPPTVNLNGETQCRCDDSGGTWPNCAGKACSDAGWDYAAADESCGVLVTLSGGEASDQCRFTGFDAPQCADVFGADLHFSPPTLDANGATLRFVYNCDPNGETGSVPATTNTIGATACVCPDGEERIGGECVSSVAINSCRAGWTLDEDGGACGIPLTLSGGTVSDQCHFIGSASPQCADVFGADAALPAPAVDVGGATLRFVYNCDPNGEAGFIPATVNTIGATACVCPAGKKLIGGECVDNVVAQNCRTHWTLFADDGACGIPLTLSGGPAQDRCYFTGAASPQCADVFGTDLDFPAPTLSAVGATLRFVYSCDPNGETGLIPAAANTVRATTCECPAGTERIGGRCVANAVASSCRAGWTLFADIGACGIPVTLSGGDAYDQCHFTGSAAPQCDDVFGAGGLPPPVVHRGATLSFVYNCDPDGQTGLLPAMENRIGATQCACPDGGAQANGRCAPSAGNCLANGWPLFADIGACGIPVTLAGKAASDRCYLTGDNAPQCADVFGAGFDFPLPTLAADGATLGFVYNCDPAQTIGLVPATRNTIAATACSCSAGEEIRDGACHTIYPLPARERKLITYLNAGWTMFRVISTMGFEILILRVGRRRLWRK